MKDFKPVGRRVQKCVNHFLQIINSLKKVLGSKASSVTHEALIYHDNERSMVPD